MHCEAAFLSMFCYFLTDTFSLPLVTHFCALSVHSFSVKAFTLLGVHNTWNQRL